MTEKEQYFLQVQILYPYLFKEMQSGDWDTGFDFMPQYQWYQFVPDELIPRVVQ
jgi:hypothetical protein